MRINNGADEQVLKGVLDALVLYTLKNNDNYGFGIKERLAQILGDHVELLKEATLYPLLHRLEAKDLLNSYQKPGDRGTPRKYYSITNKGKDLLNRRQKEWGVIMHVLQNTILQGDIK